MKSVYQKREEATDRHKEHAQRTVEQKIANCLNRRGKSKRELARLQVTSK